MLAFVVSCNLHSANFTTLKVNKTNTSQFISLSDFIIVDSNSKLENYNTIYSEFLSSLQSKGYKKVNSLNQANFAISIFYNYKSNSIKYSVPVISSLKFNNEELVLDLSKSKKYKIKIVIYKVNKKTKKLEKLTNMNFIIDSIKSTPSGKCLAEAMLVNLNTNINNYDFICLN